MSYHRESAVEVRRVNWRERCSQPGGCKYQAAIWLTYQFGTPERLNPGRNGSYCNMHGRIALKRAKENGLRILDQREGSDGAACVKRKLYARFALNRRFCKLIRERRRQLDLTQEQVARRIKLSVAFVQNLESGKRSPSDETVIRLAKVLGLDKRELFILANRHARVVLGPPPNNGAGSAWEQFRNNRRLRRVHKVTKGEMEFLLFVASLGELRAPHEFIYVLNVVRQALGR